MRKRLFLAGFGLAASVLPAAAAWQPQLGGGNAPWAGPGWYVEDVVLDVYAGPFASKDDFEETHP